MRVAILSLVLATGLGYGGVFVNKATADDKADIQKSIEEFRNRTIYRQLNAEILAGIPDDKVEQAILDYVYLKIGHRYDNEKTIVAGLAPGFMIIYATWGVEAEVNNGGFNQYFWNPTGQFAAEAVEGFRAIGAPAHAALVSRAIEVERKEHDRLEALKARGTLQAFSESYEANPLNELDDEFYRLAEDISALRIAFIRAHPSLFVGN
jgi:Domain of unknown function (DUF4375)